MSGELQEGITVDTSDVSVSRTGDETTSVGTILCDPSTLNRLGKPYANLMRDARGTAIPVVLVDTSGRCTKNESEEKIIPNEIAWIPNLVETITHVVSNGSKVILVDKKLIEGTNPDARGKILIPFILAFQYFFVIKQIQRAIKDDIASESKPSWELRDMGSASRKF
ncbi:translocase of chloroplast 34, chloroplastic-like [Malania oleifera]|uniref:translocase of chloroplast 34, chloroplastic-like n=1 Tax=Malania oleifera TaxID=397392 RepID=UPI0025AE5724|nr:translocase of chloroplast 34, chloroplastic-like [Malania oleifera]